MLQSNRNRRFSKTQRTINDCSIEVEAINNWVSTMVSSDNLDNYKANKFNNSQ